MKTFNPYFRYYVILSIEASTLNWVGLELHSRGHIFIFTSRISSYLWDKLMNSEDRIT